MRKIILLLIFIYTHKMMMAQNVGIGTASPHASAQLDVASINKGVLLPRMTLSQRNDIATPATGLLIYQTDNIPGFYYYNGASWVQFSTGSATNYWTANGTSIVSNNTNNVGIGVNPPAYKLDIDGRMRIRTGTIGNVSTSSGMWLEDYRDETNRAFIGMQDSIRVGFYGAGTGGAGWGFNFNTVTGNVGIGITNALSALHVHSPENTFNSYLRLTHQASGTSFSDGAYMGLDGNNLLFRNSESGSMLFSNSGGDRLIISSAGNVGIGIGVTTPQVKLHIDGGTNVSSATGGYLQLGPVSAGNMAFDLNEIQVRNNGLPAELTLQNYGGGLQIGSGSAVVNITAAGKVNRNGITATADMLPICYGKVRSDGIIVSGTGNFSVTKNTTVEGVYNIGIPGESMSANPDNYVIVISPTSIFNDLGADFVFTSSEIQTTGNVFKVETREFKVDYINRSLANNCNPFDCQYDLASYISNAPSARHADASFNFLVYKLY